MSFATKILMFLDPENCPVLDLKIAKAYANLEDFAPLKELVVYYYKKKETIIPITQENSDYYERWACWCRCVSALVNKTPESPCRELRAVDVERALFMLTGVVRGGRALLQSPCPSLSAIEQALAGAGRDVRTLLAGPPGGNC